MFFTVRSKDIDAVWPMVEPFLKRMEVETMTVSSENVLNRLQNSEAQLFGFADSDGIKGIAVTEVRENVRGRYCNIWICVGELDDALDNGLALIEGWARDNGCLSLEIIGRKGWKRRLRGFKERAVVLEKDLRTLQ